MWKKLNKMEVVCDRNNSYRSVFFSIAVSIIWFKHNRQEVSRCRTRGESEECIADRKGSKQARHSTLALKPRADIIRSPKQGYEWPPEIQNKTKQKRVFAIYYWSFKIKRKKEKPNQSQIILNYLNDHPSSQTFCFTTFPLWQIFSSSSLTPED